MTQEELKGTILRNKTIHTKIQILNLNMDILDEISSVVIGQPSFSINANSDIRRTCNIAFISNNKALDVGFDKQIWLDKYVKIFVGIEDVFEEIAWTNLGVYIINNPSKMFDATNNTITIQGIDLMAKFTGLRDGVLEPIEYVVPENSNVRKAIIAVMKEFNFNKYVVSECYNRDGSILSTPYEIRVKVGGTAYDILKQLKLLLPQYQMYFDIDGIFHYDLIPSGDNEQIRVNNTIWDRILINYSKNYNFEDVKNSITVIGKTHKISNFGVDTTLANNTYTIKLEKLTSLRNNLKVGFVAPTKAINPRLNILGKDDEDLGTYDITFENREFPILSDFEDVYYVVKFRNEDEDDNPITPYFEYYGEVTPIATVEETNPSSPFNINSDMGRIRKILQGGEYDNIYTSDLAEQRAEWELYNFCRLQDSITINCVPIYWLDVNWLVEIELPNEPKNDGLYITKSISMNTSVNGTQTIQLMKYYPFYIEE